MREAGLRTWLDAVGNVHGRVDGRARDAPALILGSHYDTVMDAGKYDGALGIIVGIASVKASILQVTSPSHRIPLYRQAACLNAVIEPRNQDAPYRLIAQTLHRQQHLRKGLLMPEIAGYRDMQC